MSLVAFNGSIANPAQSTVNLGGNNLTNVNDAQATTLTVVNAADLQTLSFKNTGSHGATGTITYVPSDVRFTCNQNFDIDGTCSVGGAFQALSVFAGGEATFTSGVNMDNTDITAANEIGAITGSFSGNVYARNCILGAEPDNDATIQMFVYEPEVPADTDKGIFYFNKTAGLTYENGGTNSKITVGVGGTAGATGGALLYINGTGGTGRVYDTVYNPPPTASAYGQFSLNATVGVGGTGGTAGVADTAAQLSLDTADTAVGCSLSSGGILVNSTGKYLITVSPQFFNTGSGNHNVYFWFRVNSTNVATSSTGIYLQGNQAQQVPTVSIVLNLTANDVVKVMAASNDNEIQVLNVAAISTPYVRPAAPAIIATIVRVA
jgi:hypothetical protein